MKKLSKTAWLILGIGVLVIALSSLYMLYRGQVGEQEGLNSELSAAEALLPKITSQKENLESQLTQLKSDLAEATSSLSRIKEKYPKSVESIEYDEVLFKFADDSDLEITRLTASAPRDVKVGEVTYSVTSFDVKVEGKAVESPLETEAEYKEYIYETVDDILDFVNAIATGADFTTATVELVEISVPEPLTEEEMTEEEIQGAEMPSATIKITVYSYKGE